MIARRRLAARRGPEKYRPSADVLSNELLRLQFDISVDVRSLPE
jgi:hypothetical protein